MYLKLEDAVKLGVTLDGNAPFFMDHGSVVVFVDSKAVKAGKKGAK